MKAKLMPDTLFGRLISALLAVVGITVLIIGALIVRERRDLLFWGGEAAAIANAVAETSTALAALPADARAAEIARLRSTPIAISRSSALRQAPFEPENYAAAMSSLRSRLERDLGAEYRVDVRPARPGPPGEAIRVRAQSVRGESFERPEPRRDGGPGGPREGGDGGPGGPSGPREGGPGGPGGPREGGGPGGGDPRREFAPRGDGPGMGFGPRFGGPRELEVEVTLPDGDGVMFRTDVPRAGPPLPTRIFVELAVLTLALGVALFLMARTITRPLTELARAADAVGRGERHRALRESGARELREATHAFNVMQERLHRYLDSRTQVLAAMSHDLRTPLTRLKLRVESLDDPALRERFGADLDEMIGMVTNALNLFKGVDDEPFKATDVGALLADLRREFADLGARVEITGGASDALMAKPQALKRCVTNLISNAVKYGGGASLVVEDDGAELVVRVLDDGPGIPEQHLDQVFEPFFRLESSRNSATGGVGLGLGIARDIAQAHGGSLVLRNRAPHGLEAVLRLPKKRA